LEAAQISLERQTDYLLHQYSETQTCVVVARDVDELQHFFWDALTEPHQKVNSLLPRLKNYFQSLDNYLGRMLDWAGPEARVVILSDHGFGPLEGIWHLNEWLRSKGYLSLKSDFAAPTKSNNNWSLRARYGLGRRLLKGMKNLGWEGKSLESALEHMKLRGLSSADLTGIDWESTLAYAGNVGEEWLPIYINLQRREPRGAVSGERYEQIRDDLIRTLLNCDHPQVLAVHRSEELFDLSDGRFSQAPDLVVQTNSGAVQSDFALGSSLVYEPSRYRTACHRRRGLFLLSGPEIIPGQGAASLLDIPATILAWIGLPIPGYFDGRPLAEFIPGINYNLTEALEPAPSAKREFYSSEEEAGVREKLESLGYL
jgi:predicted AlkP superfamily phosphohydrolase/phosphomutase